MDHCGLLIITDNGNFSVNHSVEVESFIPTDIITPIFLNNLIRGCVKNLLGINVPKFVRPSALISYRKRQYNIIFLWLYHAYGNESSNNFEPLVKYPR